MVDSSKTPRNIDIVFHIDGSRSMAPFIEKIRAKLPRFLDSYAEVLAKKGIDVSSLRVKTVVFRDFAYDEDAMEESDWFVLPEQNAAFKKHMEGLDGHGGGEEGENGFEALEIGCAQTFVHDVEDRQIVLLFTDAAPLELGSRASSPAYQRFWFSRDLGRLFELWDGYTNDPMNTMISRLRRLLFFAPPKTMYEEIFSGLEKNAMFQPVKLGGGLADLDFAKIEDALINCVV